MAAQKSHNVICDLCGSWPFQGVGYKCIVCDDWDYCALCYCLGRHSRNHVQLKMQTNRKYREITDIAQPIVGVYASMEHDEGKFHQYLISNYH